jgi:hypothetical protein
MYSSLIGKIAKSRLYAEEPERLQFESFALFFREIVAHIVFPTRREDGTAHVSSLKNTVPTVMGWLRKKILDGMVEIQVS